MKLYDLSCPSCGWRSQLPVDANIAKQYVGTYCLDCQARGLRVEFLVKERIVVGPTQFFEGGKWIT